MNQTEPPCRWRGPELSPEWFGCNSPKLLVPPTGVRLEMCNKCYCCDHEPVNNGRDKPSPKLQIRKIDCVHLGPVLVERGGCQGQHIYECKIHGKCTKAPCPREKLPCCIGGLPDSCTHYQAPATKNYVLINKQSPGDCLVMSAAIQCLQEQHPSKYKIGVKTSCDALFENNPHVEKDPPNAEEIQMEYELVHKSNQQPIHFLHAYVDFLSKRLSVPLKLTTNRPCLYLSEEEKNWIPQVEEVLGATPSYWIINAGTKSDFTAKGWGHANYQKVVDAFAGKVVFVQVGESGHLHKPLKGVLNLLGKTDTRELIRLCYHAKGGIGPTTFLQHIMAALEKPYVCLLGGREPLSWTTYPMQTTFHTMGALDCCRTEACWKTRTIPLNDGEDGKHSTCLFPMLDTEALPKCMTLIKPEEVCLALERLL